jgi:hypothetical protein
MENNNNIIKWLEEYCPDKAPKEYLSEYELGMLVGQRKLIEHLKVKLKILEEKEEIK